MVIVTVGVLLLWWVGFAACDCEGSEGVYTEEPQLITAEIHCYQDHIELEWEAHEGGILIINLQYNCFSPGGTQNDTVVFRMTPQPDVQKSSAPIPIPQGTTCSMSGCYVDGWSYVTYDFPTKYCTVPRGPSTSIFPSSASSVAEVTEGSAQYSSSPTGEYSVLHTPMVTASPTGEYSVLHTPMVTASPTGEYSVLRSPLVTASPTGEYSVLPITANSSPGDTLILIIVPFAVAIIIVGIIAVIAIAIGCKATIRHRSVSLKAYTCYHFGYTDKVDPGYHPVDLENVLIAAESLRSIYDSLEYHQVSVQPQLEGKHPIHKSAHSEGESYVAKLVTNSTNGAETETNPIPFNDSGQKSGNSIPSTCYSPDTSASGTAISIQLSSSSSSSGYSSGSSADIDLQVTPPAMPEQSQEPVSTMKQNTVDSDTATNTTVEDIDVQFDKKQHLVPYNPHKDESATDEELAPDQSLNSGYVIEGNTIGSTEIQHEVTNLLSQEDTDCNDYADTHSEPEQGSDNSNSSEDQHADPQESKHLLHEDVASRHPTTVTESGYVWEEHMDTQSQAEEYSGYQADTSNILFQEDINAVTMRIPTSVSESSYMQEEHFHHLPNSTEGNSDYQHTYCHDIVLSNVPPYEEAINGTSFPFSESSYVQEEQFRYHSNRNQDGSESNDGSDHMQCLHIQ